MESITSLELKDLFHKCPRLKSKLSGQELRAIADTIEQRVRIQHSHLLARINRLEMNRSASTKKPTPVFETGEEGSLSQAHHRLESILSSKVKGKNSCSSPQTRVKFALSFNEDGKVTNDKEAATGSEYKDDFAENRRLIEFCGAINNNENINTYSSSTGEQSDGKKRPKERLEEESEDKDKLIVNLNKEIDFIKSSLREKSDYEQILEESVRLQKCIEQLKIDQDTRRKDNFNLMKDIERMRYALQYNHYQEDSCPDSEESPSDSGPRPAHAGQFDSDNKKKTSNSEKKNKTQYSVLVSSQYFYSECCSPDRCPWRKQLKPCRDILSKKYRENAYLRSMLSHTQERLSKLTAVPLPPLKNYKNI